MHPIARYAALQLADIECAHGCIRYILLCGKHIPSQNRWKICFVLKMCNALYNIIVL